MRFLSKIIEKYLKFDHNSYYIAAIIQDP